MGAIVCFASAFTEFTGLSPQQESLLVLVTALVATLLLGAIVLALVDRWRKKQLNVTINTQEELASYRELYQRGELSAEEYEKVRTRLANRLKFKPKPVEIHDPETGTRIVLKNPTVPVVPPAPKPLVAPPSPPPDLPSS